MALVCTESMQLANTRCPQSHGDDASTGHGAEEGVYAPLGAGGEGRS